jgi:hypothetical protein
MFTIRSKALHLTSIFRTTDAWMCNWTLIGIPELQQDVHDRLVRSESSLHSLELGTYTQMHFSFHMYLDEIPNAEQHLRA